jgi:hypothetical protein
MLSMMSKLSMVLAAAGLLVIAQAGEQDESCSGKACDATKAASQATTGCGSCPSTVATSIGESTPCGGGGCPSKATATSCPSSCSGQGSATLTSAAPSDGCPASTCETSACAAASGSECQECPGAAAMARLPKMTFVVGEEKTCCPDAATELAKTSDGCVKYAVADETFDCQATAHRALVETTEKFVSTFVEPKTCSQSGLTSVAGNQFQCDQAAKQCSTVARSAMDNVRMTYLVGEKSCHCPNEAKQLAETSGDPIVYVVDDQKTCCDLTARLNCARAKYKAAVIALLRADAEVKTASTGS